MLKDLIRRENASLAEKECLDAASHMEEAARLLKKAAAEINESKTDDSEYNKSFKRILFAQESAAKKIAGAQCLIRKDSTIGIDEDERFLQMAKNMNVKVEVEDDVIRIAAPVTFLKTTDGSHHRAIGRAVYAAVADSMREKGMVSPLFEKADIRIIHHINPSDIRMNIPDADNVDTKSLIDALDGLLIPNDDLLTVRITEYGMADDEDYTEVIIQKQNLSFL